jgi:hypothetical protein
MILCVHLDNEYLEILEKCSCVEKFFSELTGLGLGQCAGEEVRWEATDTIPSQSFQNDSMAVSSFPLQVQKNQKTKQNKKNLVGD